MQCRRHHLHLNVRRKHFRVLGFRQNIHKKSTNAQLFDRRVERVVRALLQNVLENAPANAVPATVRLNLQQKRRLRSGRNGSDVVLGEQNVVRVKAALHSRYRRTRGRTVLRLRVFTAGKLRTHFPVRPSCFSRQSTATDSLAVALSARPKRRSVRSICSARFPETRRLGGNYTGQILLPVASCIIPAIGV